MSTSITPMSPSRFGLSKTESQFESSTVTRLRSGVRFRVDRRSKDQCSGHRVERPCGVIQISRGSRCRDGRSTKAGIDQSQPHHSSGPVAGYQLTTGSNNIAIGNQGIAGESGAIRIGSAPLQTSAFVAGITVSHITGSAVYITTSGQLGVLASSERYKTSIRSLPDGASKLQQLRPVSFHLKNDVGGVVQYGLIAEEVDSVYPELVLHDATGKIEGIRYDELAPLIIRQMQQQQALINAQAAALRSLRKHMAKLEEVMKATRVAANPSESCCLHTDPTREAL